MSRFFKKRKDRYAYVHCHATHTLFDGTWSTVKNVVDTANPESSLILRKRPRVPNDSRMDQGSARAIAAISLLSSTCLGAPCRATSSMARPICSVVRM